MVNQENYLEEVPECTNEKSRFPEKTSKAEFTFLYNLGIKEDELEYLIMIRSREIFGLEAS